MKSVVIYNRTSTLEQNPANQLKACQSINKYGKAEVISEQQSAWKDSNREGFEKLKQAIVKGQVKHLICWDFDRLYRNRRKFVKFFEMCQNYGCRIHSYRQTWLDSFNDIPEPWNEIMLQQLIHVFGWMAEDESDKKSQRVKEAVRRTAKGTYSYKGNKWGKKPITTHVRNKVYKLADEGKSIREIAKLVVYYDSNRNPHNISKSAVHKLLTEKNAKIS